MNSNPESKEASEKISEYLIKEKEYKDALSELSASEQQIVIQYEIKTIFSIKSFSILFFLVQIVMMK